MKETNEEGFEGVLLSLSPPIKTIEIRLQDISESEYAKLLSASKVRIIPVSKEK